MAETKAREWAIFSVQVLGQISVTASALSFCLLALGRINVSLARPLVVFVIGLALLGVVGVLRRQYREVSTNAILYGLSGCLMAGATYVLATGSVWAIAAMLIASIGIGFFGFYFGLRHKRAGSDSQKRGAFARCTAAALGVMKLESGRRIAVATLSFGMIAMPLLFLFARPGASLGNDPLAQIYSSFVTLLGEGIARGLFCAAWLALDAAFIWRMFFSKDKDVDVTSIDGLGD